MALSTQEYIAVMAIFNTKDIAEYAITSQRADEVSLSLFEVWTEVPLVEQF